MRRRWLDAIVSRKCAGRKTPACTLSLKTESTGSLLEHELKVLLLVFGCASLLPRVQRPLPKDMG